MALIDETQVNAWIYYAVLFRMTFDKLVILKKNNQKKKGRRN